MADRRTKVMVPVLMFASFLGSLSQNMLTSALPSIIAEFGVSALVGQWLTTVYIMVLGVITALTAYLFRRVRTRLLLTAAILIFTAGCVLSLLARGFWTLVLSRAIQATGSGVLIPVLQMILVCVYPPEQRGRALGLSGIVVGFAPAVGPSVSGLLVDSFGWRSLFVVLAAAMLIAAVAGIFAFRQVGEQGRPPMRLGSALLYGAGFSLFTLAVTWLGGEDVPLMRTLLFMCAGALLLALFVRIQLRDSEPLLRLSLFRYRSMRTGTALMILAYTAMTSGAILIPIYIQSVCGYSATVSGLVMLPGSLLLAALSPVTGRLTDRLGIHAVAAAGLVLLLIGTGGFALVSEGTPLAVTVLLYVARSVALGFLLMPLTAHAISEVPPDGSSHGMAILNSLRQLGGSLCSTLLTLCAEKASRSSSLDLGGFRFASVLTAAFVLLALALWLRPKTARRG